MLTDAQRGCISQLCACLGAWQGKMEPNQISLVSRPQCALAVWGEGFRAGCQGWDEAPGPALGDLQSRNMPAKMIFLNLIISQRRRWMQGQSCRYHSQHHHHPHLQMIPARTGCDYLRVCVCVCVCVYGCLPEKSKSNSWNLHFSLAWPTLQFEGNCIPYIFSLHSNTLLCMVFVVVVFY